MVQTRCKPIAPGGAAWQHLDHNARRAHRASASDASPTTRTTAAGTSMTWTAGGRFVVASGMTKRPRLEWRPKPTRSWRLNCRPSFRSSRSASRSWSIATEEGELPEDTQLNRRLDAAVGLTRVEAENAFSLSLVRHSQLTAETTWQLKAGGEHSFPAGGRCTRPHEEIALRAVGVATAAG